MSAPNISFENAEIPFATTTRQGNKVTTAFNEIPFLATHRPEARRPRPPLPAIPPQEDPMPEPDVDDTKFGDISFLGDGLSIFRSPCGAAHIQMV